MTIFLPVLFISALMALPVLRRANNARNRTQSFPLLPWPITTRSQDIEPPPVPSRLWPGTANEYQIVRYRTDAFQVIEGRIPIQTMESISRVLKTERAKGHAGRLFRTSRGQVKKVAQWTAS